MNSNRREQEAKEQDERLIEEPCYGKWVSYSLDEFHSRVERDRARKLTEIPPNISYLQSLAEFVLRPDVDDSQMTNKITSYGGDDVSGVPLGHGYFLEPCNLSLEDGSVNNALVSKAQAEYPAFVNPKNKHISRIITIYLLSGFQISFTALMLGRLSLNWTKTSYWIVFLDKKKHFWALQAKSVDSEELPAAYDEAWNATLDEDKDFEGDDDLGMSNPYRKLYVSLVLQLHASTWLTFHLEMVSLEQT